MDEFSMAGRPTWFLVATKPRAEAQAQLHLERQAYRVCAPKIEVKRRRRGVWQQVVEPLFPSYVFVQVVLGEQDIAPIRSTVGCLSIVHFGGCPSKVRDAVMRPFLALGNAPFVVEKNWQKGGVVRFESGPFAGLEAVFSMKEGAGRVVVLMTMLGAQKSIVVDESDISMVG